ncbi:pro-sigmaK processing inhibitor BofA family protein [Cellulosilyticum sp. I15G10I2]|uniref:pro-sigmaK processing inhibitor BofA family protein n=1 Tax=Cellulosilyticum sp. I15G10I2 TaxID=1892843 RepID=UPI00085BBD1A|nr:pro-sigmaK processing inhibitor BofA family protein [Cellulosilyticum sp. I15G10I2]
MFGIHPAILISIGICIVILLWVLLKEKFIQAVVRMIVGGILIYFLNGLLPQYAIGINAISLTCSGILGIPGVAMLYIVGAVV